MATARKLPSGQWRTLIYSHTENGKRIYESFTADTKRESEYLAAQFKLLNKKSSNISVGEAIEKYIEIKKNVISPSTYRNYLSTKSLYYCDIEDIKLNKLQEQDVQAWINNLSSSLSYKTVKNIYGLFHAAVKTYNKSFDIDITLPQKTKPELHIPTDAEIENVIKSCTGRDLRIAILLAAFGSLRRSEICALDYSDIKGNTITINKAIVLDCNKKYILKPPKTFSSYRTVAMPDFVIQEIGTGKGRIIEATPSQISDRFRKLINKNNITHFRFHDLRHYQASILHAIGVPNKYIMERGGWKSESTLKNIYQHTLADKEGYFDSLAIGYFENMQHKMQHENHLKILIKSIKKGGISAPNSAKCCVCYLFIITSTLNISSDKSRLFPSAIFFSATSFSIIPLPHSGSSSIVLYLTSLSLSLNSFHAFSSSTNVLGQIFPVTS